MKKINNMDLITSAVTEIANYKRGISGAETEKRAKAVGNAALGFINGMTVVINAMICMENNDFTGDFGEWIDEQEKAIRNSVEHKIIMLKGNEGLL